MRRAKWVIVRDDTGWHVRLEASNGLILLSSEVYATRHHALRGLAAVRRAVDGAGVVPEHCDARTVQS